MENPYSVLEQEDFEEGEQKVIDVKYMFFFVCHNEFPDHFFFFNCSFFVSTVLYPMSK
jgi:hypothetical protein